MANLQMSVIVPDCSFYQDNNATPQKVDFAKMKSAGARGVIIRMGQNSWIDEDAAYNWQAAKTAGLPRGAYWFYDSRNSPTAQAGLFVSMLKNDLPEMEVWCDYEENYGGTYKGWRNFAVFVALVRDLLPASRIGIYTGYYYFKDHCPNPVTEAANLAWFARYPLWIANYNPNPVNVLIPAPWTTALYWQFTDNGDGPKYGTESLNVDLSYFNGSILDFNARYAVTPPPPPPPVDDDVVRVTSVTMGGVVVPYVLTVTGTVNAKGWVYTIDQRPPVEPPPPPVTGNFYRVDAAKWPITHAPLLVPPNNGPLTQTICHTPKQAQEETPLSVRWQGYIKSWNTARAWELISSPSYGPSKGINGNGLLRYIGLVWPSNASSPNIVKVLEIVGAWARIDSIPIDGSADLAKISPTLTPWLFHRVCDNKGNPVSQNIVCPILGGVWYCPLAALTKV